MIELKCHNFVTADENNQDKQDSSKAFFKPPSGGCWGAGVRHEGTHRPY